MMAVVESHVAFWSPFVEWFDCILKMREMLALNYNTPHVKTSKPLQVCVDWE